MHHAMPLLPSVFEEARFPGLVYRQDNLYGPCSRDRNQWSFDMFFAQESFKNALFLMILVCMDRAQSEELGTLYFCRCQMYIS